MNSHSIFKEITTNSGPIIKGKWHAPHKLYCYLLNVLIKYLHNWHNKYLDFEFLKIVITNYFKI